MVPASKATWMKDTYMDKAGQVQVLLHDVTQLAQRRPPLSIERLRNRTRGHAATDIDAAGAVEG